MLITVAFCTPKKNAWPSMIDPTGEMRTPSANMSKWDQCASNESIEEAQLCSEEPLDL